MRKLSVALFYLLAVLSVSACSGEKTVHWKQEAQLQDGRVIVVERTSTQTGTIFPENIRMEKSQRILFKNPNNDEMVTWDIPQGLKPYALDFEDSVPYLVLDTYTVGDYNRWSCPNPPYFVYRYKRGAWESAPFEQLPSHIERRNLFDMSKTFEKYATSETASLADMQKFLNHLDKNRRVIGREKINSNAEGCFPSVLEKLGRSDEITEKFYRKSEAK